MKPASLIHHLCLISAASLLLIPAVQANQAAPLPSAVPTKLRDLKQPAKTIKEWLAQSESTPSIVAVQVTGVKLDRIDQGLDITLETADGKPLQVDATKFRAEGKSLIAVIPNAVLALPNAQEFNADNPTSEIAAVRVTQTDASTIRVSILGTTALPKSDVTLKVSGLAYSLNPEGQTPEEELVVTGAGQRGYRVPNSSTATKTDTPLRDIPQSIQIVPRQLLDDRQVTRIQQIADTVPGVQAYPGYGGVSSPSFLLRGFKNDFSYRDGFRDFENASPVDIAGIERIEVLKGPASVLYGQGEPGGLVNIVSKQPLTTPYYAASFTAGSYSLYRPTLDVSGPLNPDKTIAYRLNVAYENAGSFRDFVNSDSIYVAPALSFQIGKNTTLKLNFEYQRYRYTFDRFFDFGGVQPEFLAAPISRFLGEPGLSDGDDSSYRVSYVLEHKFNENWKFRSAFAAILTDLDDLQIGITSLEDDRRTLNRYISHVVEATQNYTLQNELTGKFNTGSVQHQVLFGVELFRYRFTYRFFDSTIAPIDLFNPIYGARPQTPFVPSFGDSYGTDDLSFYFQDQVTFSPQWKLLAGGRVDLARTRDRDLTTNELNADSSDTAFSPRVGLVYQPTDRLSLYASYASAFNPVLFGISRTGAAFEPQRGKQFEVGIKADVIPNRLSATLAAYEITKKNVLVTDPEDGRFSIQTGEQESRGIELALTGQPLPGWDISFGYALTDAFVSQDTTIPVGDQLPGVPRHQVGLWNRYEIQSGNLKGLGFGLGLYYVSDRPIDLPNGNIEAPNYFRTDVAVSYRINNLKFQININNLTNVKYFDIRNNNINPQAPLTVLGSISVEF